MRRSIGSAAGVGACLFTVMLIATACGTSRSRDDASLLECKNSVPIDYQHVELSKADEAELMAGVKAYLRSIGQMKRMSGRNYWLFESPEKDALICEVFRDARRYKVCTPDMWRLPNKSRKVDMPDIEGVCAVAIS